MRLSTPTTTKKGSLSKRMVMGFAAVASAAVVGAAGIANANAANKPTKQQCQQAGFTNYGQCVKEWAQNKNKPGNGYGNGNGNHVDTEVNIDVSGNDNTIQVILNYVFG